MNPLIVVLLILLLPPLIDAFFTTLTGRNMIYLAIKHIAKYILKKVIWEPVVNAIIENVPEEYRDWFIVNQIIDHIASKIASIATGRNMLPLLIDTIFATLTGRNMIYFIVEQIAKCILKRVIWKPVLNAMTENVPEEYQKWIALFFWLIVNQIIDQDASNIANIVAMITL